MIVYEEEEDKVEIITIHPYLTLSFIPIFHIFKLIS